MIEYITEWAEIARRAAFTFVHLKGAAVWRRLMVIAFEDVGIGSVDALATTIAAAGDSGGSPRPELYFEIRKAGKPVDPRPWFRAPDP